MIFKTPEEFFLGAAPEPVVAFDPAVYLQPNSVDDGEATKAAV
jgi:bifunctional polynucleotide phosphatase/kinase